MDKRDIEQGSEENRGSPFSFVSSSPPKGTEEERKDGRRAS